MFILMFRVEPEIQIVEENLVPQQSSRVHHNIQVNTNLLR